MTQRLAQHNPDILASLYLGCKELVKDEGPMKGSVSTQNAHQGSENKTRKLLGGTEEKNVSTMKCHLFALQANR